MGWFIVFLMLVALAFGVLGAVIKATVFIVLTIVATVVCLAMIGGWVIRRKAERFARELDRRLRP